MPRLRTPRDHRVARHMRTRQSIEGSAERPRLAVFRSLKQIYAQAIDDSRGHTLASASSLESKAIGREAGRTKTQISQKVGALIAQRLKGRGIERVVFDRGGFKYHGRVRALADGAREEGLIF